MLVDGCPTDAIPLGEIGYPHIRILQERPDLTYCLAFARCTRLGARGSRPCMRPVSDQVALELGRRRKRMEHQPAGTAPRLDLRFCRVVGCETEFTVLTMAAV